MRQGHLMLDFSASVSPYAFPVAADLTVDAYGHRSTRSKACVPGRTIGAFSLPAPGDCEGRHMT